MTTDVRFDEGWHFDGGAWVFRPAPIRLSPEEMATLLELFARTIPSRNCGLEDALGRVFTDLVGNAVRTALTRAVPEVDRTPEEALLADPEVDMPNEPATGVIPRPASEPVTVRTSAARRDNRVLDLVPLLEEMPDLTGAFVGRRLGISERSGQRLLRLAQDEIDARNRAAGSSTNA